MMRLPEMRLLEPWRTRLLWLSLALNLFAGSAIIAPHVMHPHVGGPPGFDMIVNRMAKDLFPADAEAFRAVLAHEQPWYEQGRLRLDEARRDVAAAAVQQPYDPATVRAALLAMQNQLRDSALRFDDSIALAIGKVSFEGRQRLAKNFMRKRP